MRAAGHVGGRATLAQKRGGRQHWATHRKVVGWGPPFHCMNAPPAHASQAHPSSSPRRASSVGR